MAECLAVEKGMSRDLNLNPGSLRLLRWLNYRNSMLFHPTIRQVEDHRTGMGAVSRSRQPSRLVGADA